MSGPRTYRTEAIVLRRANFGEADKILTLVTPGLGKLSVVAKAIRRPNAKLAGHLDLFCRTELLIARGRGLHVVAGAQVIDGYRAAREDLLLSSCAIFLLEFVDRFTVENMENHALYDLLTASLEALAGERNPETVLVAFELKGLEHVGYRPELRHCLHCNQAIEPEANYFGQSGVTCPNCPIPEGSRLISVDALRILRFLQTVDVETATRLKPQAAVAREAELHLRRSIRLILERELKSTSFLDLVRRPAS